MEGAGLDVLLVRSLPAVLDGRMEGVCKAGPTVSGPSIRCFGVGQTNFFLPFDRLGIDPFKDKFPITLRLEGTVRGTGGIHITDENCAAKEPGLYAAGDAATRQLICGGFTGGGSHNAAWAMSSESF